MKTNNWIILVTSLFGIANKGISFIAFILSIVVLIKYVLVDKKTLNNNVNKVHTYQPKHSSSKEMHQNEKYRKKEEKEREKARKREQEKQLVIQKSCAYFDVDFIESKVTNSKAAPYYKKIKTETEQVVDVVKAKSTKKVKNYKRPGYHYATDENGI